MEEPIKHMDPEQRAHLIMEFTAGNPKKDTVGRKPIVVSSGGRKTRMEMPSVAFIRSVWKEFTSRSYILGTEKECALYVVMLKAGYPAGTAERAVKVYAKKELVMEKGRIALEVCPQLRIAEEVIQSCVNW
jgi:hypothetical protein